MYPPPSLSLYTHIYRGTKFFFDPNNKTSERRDISTPLKCLKFLLGMGDRQGVDAEEFVGFRAIIIDHLYETGVEKYVDKITQLMEAEVAANAEDYGGGEFSEEEEEEEEEEEPPEAKKKTGGSRSSKKPTTAKTKTSGSAASRKGREGCRVAHFGVILDE